MVLCIWQRQCWRDYNWDLTVNCKGCGVVEESGNIFPLTAFIGILIFPSLNLVAQLLNIIAL